MLELITVTQWVIIENDQDTSIQEFIHNTRYLQVPSRNNAFPTCDALIGFNLNFTPYYLKTHPFLKRS